MSRPQIKKYHCFEVSSSLTLCNNNNPFLDWIVMCDEKWILYKWQRSTQWLDEEAPKHFQSSNSHEKKVMVTGGLLPVWFTTAFWILANHYIRDVCSTNWWEALKTATPGRRHWSTESAQFFSMTTPNHTLDHQGFKSWTNWAVKFYLIHHYSPDLSPTDYHFFKHLDNFLHAKCFHNPQEAEMLSKISWHPEAWIFTLQEQTHLFLIGKKCVDCNGSYFD